MKSRSDFQVTRLSDHDLLLTRSFTAPRQRVFEAWTHADQVKQWWDPTGVPLAACEIDLRPGGRFRWTHAGPTAHVFAGTYSEIDPPARLAFKVEGLPSATGSSALLEFSEAGTGTALRMLMSFASKADCDSILRMGVDTNTGKTLENLEAYLAHAPGEPKV